MDALAGLTAELQQFEAFVENYTSSMQDILDGKVSEEEKQWARDACKKEQERLHKAKDPLNYDRWDAICNASEFESSSVQSHQPIISRAAEEQTTTIAPVRQASEAADEHRKEGNRFFNEQDYAHAVVEYGKAIDADSQNPLLFTNRALANLRLGNYTDGIKDCGSAIQLDNQCIKAWWRRAEAWRATGAYFKAKSDALKIQEILKAQIKALDSRVSEKLAVANRKELAISQTQIEKLLEEIESDLVLANDEKNAKAELERRGGTSSMQGLLYACARELGKLDSTGGSLPPACSMLVELLNRDHVSKDAFRECSGFATLLAPAMLTTSSVEAIVPIVHGALRRCQVNRRMIAQHLEAIARVMISTKKPGMHTVELCSEIFLMASSELAGLHAICQMSVGAQFGAFVLALLGDAKDLVTNEQISANLLGLLNKLLKEGTLGINTVIKRWTISLSKLLELLPKHLLTELPVQDDDTKEPLFMLACRSVDVLANAPTALVALREHRIDLLDAIWKTIDAVQPLQNSTREPVVLQNTSNSIATLLATSYNIMVRAPGAMDDTIMERNILLHLVQFLSCPSPYPRISLKILGKLLTHHSQQVITTLDGWWDDVPMAQLLKTESQAASQVLAAWLSSGTAKVNEWRRQEGFPLLHNLLKRQLSLKHEEHDEVLIGNLALCIAECARKPAYAREFHGLKTTSAVVHLLRTCTSSPTQTNLAIACARLGQNGKEFKRRFVSIRFLADHWTFKKRTL
ncbi:hypothetical protein HKX48_007970 [Thoreauomyces humboldtii]|nr:hypothetical protein HKX48_007970 [Thoreauomyces humboldtii]